MIVALYWPQKDWFADLYNFLVAELLELPLLWNRLIQPHCPKVSSRPGDFASAHMEVIQRLIRKAGFLCGVAEAVDSDLRPPRC